MPETRRLRAGSRFRLVLEDGFTMDPPYVLVSAGMAQVHGREQVIVPPLPDGDYVIIVCRPVLAPIAMEVHDTGA